MAKLALDGEGPPLHIVRRRATVERWKAKNRDRYLEQKRQLSSRPEYKARRRELYRQHVQELTELGILPRPRGRPRLYEEGSQEALEARREKGRRASAHYHERQKQSLACKKDEYKSESGSENSDFGRYCRGSAAEGTPLWDWPGPANRGEIPYTVQ